MKQSLGAKTILYPTPVLVVGSYDAEGRPNVATAAWGGIVCSKPPCISVSWRAARASYENITRRRAFTVSLPSEEHAVAADYFGIVSGKRRDKFADSGLTAVRSDLVDAPYVAEFPLVLECELLEAHDLGAHTLFVGEVKDVKADASVIGEDGRIDPQILRPLIFAPGTEAYFGIGARVGDAFSIGKQLMRAEEAS